MHYHETFWVVIGSVAPVIMLSIIVAIGTLLGRRQELPQRIYVQTGWANTANLVVQMYAISSSLLSLIRHTDADPPYFIYSLEVLSIFLLLWSTGRPYIHMGKGKPTSSGSVPGPKQ